MSNYHKKRLMSATAMSALALGAFLYNPQVTQAEEGAVERIQGNDRYETATLISSQTYDASDTVIIANALEFADALAGVPLAYEKEAPILLAYGSKLRATTQDEIERLGAKEAVILGGEAAISQSIEEELKALGLSVQRISGDNRFETSALIADELEKTSPSNKAVVVDGMEFADAMSIAPFAAQEGMPIYLTKTHGLSNAGELDDYSETYIVGGETAVSTTVEDALNSVTRLAGLDRYETNREVLEYFGVEASELFVSTGLNFADALTGSVLAAQNNSAVALVKGDVHSKLLDQFGYSPFTRFTILGGEAAVSNRVKGSLDTYLESKTEIVQEEKQENIVDYPVEEVENANLPSGETNTIQKGKSGYKLLTYKVTYVNGVETSRVEVDRVTIDPIKKITEIGTQVTEVTEETLTENVVAYEIVTQENNQLPEGETRILQQGTDSYDEVTYEVTLVNGEETERHETTRTTVEPVNEIKEIGTQVTEVIEEVVTENIVTFETVTQENDQLPEGETRILQEGTDGYDEVIYEITLINGKETERLETARTTVDPVKEIVEVGTQVTEVIEEVVTENIVTYETVTQENDQLPEGETRILQEGTDGYDEVTYMVTYVNGEETNSIEVKRMSIEPIIEIKEIGTKEPFITEEVSFENYKWAETIYIEDDTMLEGEEDIVEYGMEGYEFVTYKVSYYDDIEVEREEVSREIYEPINQVIRKGTLKNSEVNFVDFVFEEEVRELISKPEGQIMISDINHIKRLWLGSYINNLGGIENFHNLEDLTFSGIDSIEDLSSLTNLKILNITNNYIEDISTLSSLINLEHLTMNYNEITDISSLSNLTKLTYLSANNNNIVDISSLEDLTEIEYLNLGDNSIESIDSLRSMKVLERAYLGNNSITNLKPLENLDSLRAIYLYNNKINDITPLLSTTIRELSIQRNNLVEEQYLQLEEALGIRIYR